MPLGKYKDFAACKSAKTKEFSSAERANKWCGALYWKVHGKKEGTKKLKHELEKLKKELEDYVEKRDIEKIED